MSDASRSEQQIADGLKKLRKELGGNPMVEKKLQFLQERLKQLVADHAAERELGDRKFQREIRERESAEKMQSSLFQISEAAHTAENLEGLYRKIHQIISGLMAAENFYIALYEAGSDSIHFPYFVDQFDSAPEPKNLGKGLTEYVLKTGEPLLASPEVFDRLVDRGEVELIGAPSIDWLGVPLKIRGKIIGVLVLQSYREGIRYSAEDANLLMFVSNQVAMAIERKRAEEAIGQAKRQWERTFDTVPDLIAILDREHRIVRINKAMAERLGVSPREAIGLKCHKSVHRLEGPPSFCPHALLLLDQKEHEQEVHEANLGGDFFVTVSPLYDSDGELTGSVHVARDITERKRVEEAHKNSENLLRTIINATKEAMITLGEDGLVSLFNPAAEEMFGRTREEMLGQTIDVLMPEEYRKTHHHDVRSFFQSGKPDNAIGKTLILPGLRKDGKLFHMEISLAEGQFSGGKFVIAVIRDITLRLQIEGALRESEERYRRLFEESKDMIYITSADGEFLDINPAGVSMLGYGTRDELLHAHVRDTYLDSRDREEFQRRMAGDGYVKDLELTLKRRDGQPLFVLITATALKDPAGKISAYRGIIHDITERRMLELQLFQAQKMESIGTLAGGIAHDFNNILSGILGYASFMREKIDESHPFFSYIDIIQRGAKRAAELTSKLLAFARNGRYDSKPVNLNRVVVDTLDIIGRTFEKSIEVKKILDDGLPTVEIDPIHFQQVLMNLFVNARDAMPDGGRLIIETGIKKFSGPQIRRDIEGPDGTYVFVSVEDSGRGMDKALMQRIFDPFFTTKEKGKGTGLGLSMVYGVVRNHGGFVRVYSEPGHGSVFRVYLPVSGKPEEVGGEERTDRNLQGRERILVVDDEEDIRTFLADIFREYGYDVILAENGHEAVSLYGERGKKRIDLVILDMIMPKLGGRETFLKLKAIDPQVRVLLSTGFSQKGEAQRIINEGVLGFIQKPYQVNELLAQVRQILDGLS